MSKNNSSAPIISVENISKKYFLTGQHHSKKSSTPKDNSFWALKDISFQLNQGDTLGIIGSNGSGKTTLLKILSQATAPTNGRVVQYGKLIPIIDIGSGFHPDLTGRENVFLYGTVMLGMKKADLEKNLDAIIEFSELGRFIDEPIKNYSNGMYLRLALSVALFCQLDILLLDEIFSVGDSAFMLKSYEKMNQIIQQAATVILASHSMDDIMRICNKCLWLEKGEIKMIGTTNEVISKYLQSNEYLSEKNTKIESLSLHHTKEWTEQDAPQSDEFMLRQVAIRNKGKDTAEVDYNDTVIIDIFYTKIVADCEIGFTIMVADHYNTPLLLTSHHFEPTLEKKFYGRAGIFKCTCIIPGKLLNLGIYKINLQVFLNNAAPINYVSNVLTFRIISANKEQGDILKANPTKFVPALTWEIAQLS